MNPLEALCSFAKNASFSLRCRPDREDHWPAGGGRGEGEWDGRGKGRRSGRLEERGQECRIVGGETLVQTSNTGPQRLLAAVSLTVFGRLILSDVDQSEEGVVQLVEESVEYGTQE